MMRDARAKEVEARRVLVEALDREVDLRRTFVADRAQGLSTKASILVASASLLTALQAAKSPSLGLSLAIALAAVAAILGVIVLLPRVGEELPIFETEENLWNESGTEALRGLVMAKNEILMSDERALFWRARALLVGFASLGLSLLIAALVLTNLLPN